MASYKKGKTWTAKKPVWHAQWRDPPTPKHPYGPARTRKLDDCFTEAEAREATREIERRVNAGLPGQVRDELPKLVEESKVEPEKVPLVTESLDAWSRTLKNVVGESDGQQIRKWLVTSKALAVPLNSFGLRDVKNFVAELAASTLKGGSQGRQLTYLGRWCSWAVGKELIAINPVRSLPKDLRPVYERPDPTTQPWTKTEEEFQRIWKLLPEGMRLPYEVGYRCGLRQGESFGLRLLDIEGQPEGYLQVAKSWGPGINRKKSDGGLKENRRGKTPKVKHPPIPKELAVKLLQLAQERRAAGAGDESLLFVPTAPGKRKQAWTGYLPHTVGLAFRKLGGIGTWKDHTRHSFASGKLLKGWSTTDVAAALGHASVVTTEKSYVHLIRRRYPRDDV